MNRLLSIFYPRKCPYCSRLLKYDMTECLICRAEFPNVPRIEALPTGEICIAPFTYSGAIRRAICDYKFRGKKFNCYSFAGAVVSSIRNVYYKDMGFEIITCVPMSKDRRRERGFNQSELIARYTAEQLNKPFENLLCRDSGAALQHEMTYEERISGNDNSYHIITPENVRGKKILLIDDIMTTGMTLSRCSAVLKSYGAERVFCASVAISKEYDSHNNIQSGS